MATLYDYTKDDKSYFLRTNRLVLSAECLLQVALQKQKQQNYGWFISVLHILGQ